MDTEIVRIDGLNYCNLRSLTPYVFVNIDGSPAGGTTEDSTLPAVPMQRVKGHEMVLVHREVDELFKAQLGLPADVRGFVLEKHIGPVLLEYITALQRWKKVDVVVIDADIFDGVKFSRLPMTKLFMPLMQDIHRHRFYKYKLGYLAGSAVRAQSVMQTPHNYRFKTVKL